MIHLLMLLALWAGEDQLAQDKPQAVFVEPSPCVACVSHVDVDLAPVIRVAITLAPEPQGEDDPLPYQLTNDKKSAGHPK